MSLIAELSSTHSTRDPEIMERVPEDDTMTPEEERMLQERFKDLDLKICDFF